MKTCSLLKPIRLKDGRTYPQGERFALTFAKTDGKLVGYESPYLIATLASDPAVSFKSKRFQSFFRAPSVATMEKWMDSGIARTVSGDKTEPDGYGPDGAPSWLLAMGLI
jgi:hypothetical protein